MGVVAVKSAMEASTELSAKHLELGNPSLPGEYTS